MQIYSKLFLTQSSFEAMHFFSREFVIYCFSMKTSHGDISNSPFSHGHCPPASSVLGLPASDYHLASLDAKKDFKMATRSSNAATHFSPSTLVLSGSVPWPVSLAKKSFL